MSKAAGLASRIDRLPQFLTWEHADTFPRAVADEYVALQSSSFDGWLADNGHEAAARLCRRLYSALPRPEKIRFLRIAGTGVKVLRQNGGTDFADDFYIRHLQRHLPSAHSDGDRGRMELDVLPLAGPEKREIWVDGVGVYGFPGPARLCPYGTEEAREAFNRLQQNLERVRAASVVAADTIWNSIQLIVLRKDGADPNGFSSSSWPGCAGLMALTNIQHPDRSNGWDVDALVHESVHSLLYMIECFEPFYLNAHAPLAHTAISPWSGKALKLHSFVHACFVWCALLCFWNRAATSKCLPEATTEFFRRRARHGFDADLLARLGPAQFEIAGSVRGAIEKVQQIARGSP